MKCERCGNDFTPDRPNQKRFCSNTCRHRHSNAQARKRKAAVKRIVKLVWYGQHIEIKDTAQDVLLKAIWLRDYDFNQVAVYEAAVKHVEKMNWQVMK